MLTGLLWNFWSFVVLFTIIHFGCWFEFVKLMKKIYADKYLPYCLFGLIYITMPVLMTVSLQEKPVDIFSSVWFEVTASAWFFVSFSSVFRFWIHFVSCSILFDFNGLEKANMRTPCTGNLSIFNVFPRAVLRSSLQQRLPWWWLSAASANHCLRLNYIYYIVVLVTDWCVVYQSFGTWILLVPSLISAPDFHRAY